MREYVIAYDVNMDPDRQYAEQENLAVLPQYYHFNDGVIYGDEIKLTPEEFYARLKKERSYSMGCNPARVRGILEEFLKQEKDVIAIMSSSECSGSYSTVCAVSSELTEEYPGSRIHVVDSLLECHPGGIMVHKANEMRKAGCSFEETVAWLEENKAYFDAFFLVDDLSYLVRGGRLSPISGAVGSVLNIKPILHFENGKIVPLMKCRGRQLGKKAMLEELRKLNPECFAVAEAVCADEAAEYGALLQKELGAELVYTAPISLIVGTHTGPGALGFGFMKKH